MPRRLSVDTSLTGLREVDALASHTYAGQAHLAGTGPAGKTCRECEHFKGDGYNVGSGLPRPGRCQKFMAMMNSAYPPKIPAAAAACKYFVPATEPMAPTAREAKRTAD